VSSSYVSVRTYIRPTAVLWRALIESVARVASMRKAIKIPGVRIALDDFGTGYSIGFGCGERLRYASAWEHARHRCEVAVRNGETRTEI
jgi:hypothetical protein